MQPSLRRAVDLRLLGSFGLGGVGLGMALVYWLDPERGARRRATVRDKTLHAARATTHAAEVSARDLAQRSRGLVARVRGHHEDVDDRTLTQRVRTRIGRLSSHPHAIRVQSRGGRVDLAGPILAAEHEPLLRAVRHIPGVVEVEDHLQGHANSEGISALQGGRRPRSAPLSVRWSPSTRLVAGAAGLSLIGWARRHRGIAGPYVGVGGALLLLRGATDMPLRRLLGIGAGRRAIDVRKDIVVHAPIEEVFDVFRRFDTFPKFMFHVQEVTPLGDDRWRWTVSGPAGMPVTWEAEVVRIEPPWRIAWRSLDRSAIANTGEVRFDRVGDDTAGGAQATRVSIRLSYNPLGAGALAHAVARVFGADPKRQLDDDMLRFKSLLETGKATGHQTVTRGELGGEPEAPSSH